MFILPRATSCCRRNAVVLGLLFNAEPRLRRYLPCFLMYPDLCRVNKIADKYQPIACPSAVLNFSQSLILNCTTTDVQIHDPIPFAQNLRCLHSMLFPTLFTQAFLLLMVDPAQWGLFRFAKVTLLAPSITKPLHRSTMKMTMNRMFSVSYGVIFTIVLSLLLLTRIKFEGCILSPFLFAFFSFPLSLSTLISSLFLPT